MRKPNLTEQLLFICIVIVVIMIISLGIILPRNLLPIYEDNLYNYLGESLNILDSPENSKINSEVAYIYVNNENIYISNNLNKVIGLDSPKEILSKINKEEGKFLYNKKVYYYSTITSNNTKKIALTGSSYINDMRISIFKIILLVVGITFIIVSMVILIWSNSLVNRIKKLKEKIDNLNNDNYNHKIKYDYEDEISTLEVALEKMRVYLKEEEEYKNQMYQNISHDFKTPITVMKSYIEAFEDGVITDKEAVKVSKEQLSKLEGKVHSLLYLNKLNYFKDKKDIIKERCDVSKVVFDSVDKFSLVRNDVKFTLDIDEKNTIFKGSSEMWEAIIDNILNNFIRYANKEIKITIKNNKIILFNDGPNIDKDVLNNIFSPFEKGVNGVFGLGLSIVKKTLTFLNYDINIQNTKNGVKFIIS
ncbi:MAG: HAMP domain-containing sensor histidine kinase [Bacilli bacterium]|jgi:two-component system sensor histidine kinase CssS|nr:HAMP domain-containing sensor histidine kinase [Clostridium sp.]MDY2803987.1 HAMP domain-containing sensor histidine kinase [Bacilli bacterium]CDB91407.1 two-component sensor histidine kinase CssS [Clostridium sp. CAG:302]